MPSNAVWAWTLGLCLIFTPAVGQPVSSKSHTNEADVGLGQSEFVLHCAACHGRGGKGDGYFANLLKSPPTDLTMLSRKNGGVFPFALVFETVDGRKPVAAHGDRDMPIWGRFFTKESKVAEAADDAEAFARAKILAIVEYVYRLQTK